MLLNMCSSVVDRAPDGDVSVIHEFRGEYLLIIAVVPHVATLSPGELKGGQRGL